LGDAGRAACAGAAGAGAGLLPAGLLHAQAGAAGACVVVEVFDSLIIFLFQFMVVLVNRHPAMQAMCHLD
jgi:hypothetical protein